MKQALIVIAAGLLLGGCSSWHHDTASVRSDSTYAYSRYSNAQMVDRTAGDRSGAKGAATTGIPGTYTWHVY